MPHSAIVRVSVLPPALAYVAPPLSCGVFDVEFTAFDTIEVSPRDGVYLPRMTLRALDTIGLTHVESIRTAMATPLEGSILVAGEWTNVHPSLSAKEPTLPCSPSS
eukprot:scaffold18099_cov112-Isochrysis_galbana.AAC.5